MGIDNTVFNVHKQKLLKSIRSFCTLKKKKIIQFPPPPFLRKQYENKVVIFSFLPMHIFIVSLLKKNTLIYLVEVVEEKEDFVAALYQLFRSVPLVSCVDGTKGDERVLFLVENRFIFIMTYQKLIQ